MRRLQRGAVLIALFVVLVMIATGTAVATLQNLAASAPTRLVEQRQLTLAREALLGYAEARYCLNPTEPLDALLPCPDSAAAEGVAATLCPGLSRGGLPWRTLGLPPLRDASGTCLWVERIGATMRIIAPGPATPAQVRIPALPGREVCGGHLDPAAYLDPADAELLVQLDTSALAAVCP